MPGIGDAQSQEQITESLQAKKIAFKDNICLAGIPMMNGSAVLEVSIPMHTDGIHIWNCVANEGATAQMILHDGMGLNWQGYYTTGLVDYYGCSGPMYSKWLPFSTKKTKNLKRSEIFNHLTVIAEWKN